LDATTSKDALYNNINDDDDVVGVGSIVYVVRIYMYVIFLRFLRVVRRWW